MVNENTPNTLGQNETLSLPSVESNKRICPRLTYVLRCTECELKSNKDQLPMFAFKFEISSPSQVTVNNPRLGGTETHEVAGLEFMSWIVFYSARLAEMEAAGVPQGDIDKMKKAQRFMKDNLARIHNAMGLPMNINELALDPSIYLGKELQALCYSKEEADLGADGQQLIDPTTGKGLTKTSYKLERILGPVPRTTPSAF